jgi:hypothetical protein
VGFGNSRGGRGGLTRTHLDAMLTVGYIGTADACSSEKPGLEDNALVLPKLHVSSRSATSNGL